MADRRASATRHVAAPRRRAAQPVRSGTDRAGEVRRPSTRRSATARPVPVERPARRPGRGVGDLANKDLRIASVFLLLVGYAALTTLRPIPYRDDRPTRTLVGLDVLFHMGAVMLTGDWKSPFSFTLIPSTLLAGFASGPLYSFQLVGAAAGVISTRYLSVVGIRAGIRDTAAWCGMLALVALTSGLSRRVSEESARQQMIALDRLGRLADANALLFSLHRVAQTLPASLDLDDVLDSTLSRLRDAVRRRRRSPSCSTRTPTEVGTSVRTRGYRNSVSYRTERAAAAAARGDAVQPGRGRGLALVGAAGHRRGDALRPLRVAARPRRDDRADRGRAARRPTASPASTASCSTASSSRSASPSTTPAWFRRLRIGRRRRGAHPHRPRPARPHRPVARLPRLRARPRSSTGQARRRRRRHGAERPPRPGARRSSARCATPSTTCAPTSPRPRTWPPRSRPSSTGCATAAASRSRYDDRRTEPPADPPGARAVADRPGGDHQRRAPRRGHPGSRSRGAATARAPAARGRRRRRRVRRREPVAPTPTASSACASAPPASAPRSTSTPQPGRGTRR